MSYKEIINSISPYKKEQYAQITSMEKLGACAALYLVEHDVPLTFNYLTIAMFKMFPETFYHDEDFKEYPSIDRLNRTLMHMAIPNKKENALLHGSAKQGYSLTKLGYFVAGQVRQSILTGVGSVSEKKKVMDKHKEGTHSEYVRLQTSKEYAQFKETGVLSKFATWTIYQVIPFTQHETIKSKLSLAKTVAKEESDEMMLSFIETLLEQLN